MNHKRGKPKGSRAGCTMCKPHKHQNMKGGFSPEVMGPRNFRLTQDSVKDLSFEESKSDIVREVDATFCDDPLCDCVFDADAYEEARSELLTGETAEKLSGLNVTVTWAH